MTATSLISITAGHAKFYCPGCRVPHVVSIEGAAAWGFDGNVERPTLTPSVLVTSGHFMEGHSGECWCTYNQKHPGKTSFKCERCHSLVRNGTIQYLEDCSHALAGQTVAMQPITSEWSE